MKTRWLYYFSPFMLAAIVYLIQLIPAFAEINKHESYGVVEVIVYIVLLLLLLGFDYLIKTVTNRKILYVWIIEAVLIALVAAFNNFPRLVAC
jgi:hypothetical protein